MHLKEPRVINLPGEDTRLAALGAKAKVWLYNSHCEIPFHQTMGFGGFKFGEEFILWILLKGTLSKLMTNVFVKLYRKLKNAFHGEGS